MNKSEAIRFCPEFTFGMPESNFYKDKEFLCIGYNVNFPDGRGGSFTRMEFQETSLGSNMFVPIPDTWIRRYEILHKGDSRSSNMGVAFVCISPSDRVNDPTTYPLMLMESSDVPCSSPCVYVSYHKTEEDVVKYRRIKTSITNAARSGRSNAMEIICPLIKDLKEAKIELNAGYRVALNKHEIEQHLPLTTFNDYVVPRCHLTNETISLVFTGKVFFVMDCDDNPDINNSNGVIVKWDGEKGKFAVRLSGECRDRLLPAKNIALQERQSR